MIRSRFQPQKFIIAKAARNTLNGFLQRNYRKNIELSIVVSMLLILFGFRIAANLDIRKYLEMKKEVAFEFIDIPEIPPVIEEPPKIKMEELVEIPPEPKEKVESDDLLNEVEELLNDNQEEVGLDIAITEKNNLTNDSQMGLLSGPELQIRNRRSYEHGGMEFGNRKASGDLLDHGNLDIGETSRTEKKLVADNSSLALGGDVGSKNEARHSQSASAEDIKLGIPGQRGKVLSFSSSAIGTEGYKLWNKIISELDRLNKGRYGMVPRQLKRNSRGFLIDFAYSDKTSQKISWRNDGNVWIKVIGHSDKTTVQELRRALNGLLQLSLNN